MGNQTIKNLQKATREATHSQTHKEKIESLSKAFEMFSLETARLETAYTELKRQFQELNLELEETNSQLKSKVGELDLITYYLNSILANISQGILFIDLEGNVTTYNRTAEKILGLKGTKVLFSNFWHCFNDAIFGFSMHQVLANLKSPGTTFCTYTKPNGETLELEIDISFVLKDEDDSPISTQGLIILIRDITEIRRLEVIALRNDRMKELGEMAAQVAHEIRNPLGGIKGFASLLQRDLKDQPELQKMAGYIVEGTDSLNRLVTQVLNYTRPVHLHLEQGDLIHILEDIKQHILADESIKKEDLQIKIESPYKTLNCQADFQLLRGVFLNLIVNALQAMPNGGQILIHADRQNSETIIRVEDNGSGIPEENLEKIFSPFFTTKTDGNGFGLAEVYKVVQAHGGIVEVESTVGIGSIFTIRLPQKISSSQHVTKRGKHGH